MIIKQASEKSDRSITVSELSDMLKKYNIGKKPLASLLGWGETTIVLYMSAGEVPDGEYGKRLYFLYKNPGHYLSLLEQRGSVLTEVAKRKSMNAVKNTILTERIFIAAQYVINNCGHAMAIKRLEAILFFSQLISLVMYNQELFDDDFYPDSNHLPYRKLTERYLQDGLFKVEIDDSSLKDYEKEILDEVMRDFDWYGPRAVEAILLAEHTRFCGIKGEYVRRMATKERLRKYYKELFSQNNVLSVKDFELYLHKRMTALRSKKTN